MNDDIREAVYVLRLAADQWESGNWLWFGHWQEHQPYGSGRPSLCAAMALPGFGASGPRLIARAAILAAAGHPGGNLVYWNDYEVSGLPEVISTFRAAADQLEAQS